MQDGLFVYIYMHIHKDSVEARQAQACMHKEHPECNILI